jgi:putative nucleotidyltransferase with HDIG domain
MVPDLNPCRGIWDACQVPAHLRRHSEQVARIARHLAEALRRHGGAELDVHLVETGALLHDIAKAICLQSHQDHALEGGRILRRLGYGEIAAVVERHVELGPWEPEGDVTEAEVLNYSDKRVRHEEIVTLAERFEDLLERYGKQSEEARSRIHRTWQMEETLERKIFARLPFGPEQLAGRVEPEISFRPPGPS